MKFSSFYIDVMLAERAWSWAVVGIVYLLGTLFVRRLLFTALIRETKKLDPHLFGSVRKVYQRKSVTGWILYLISFLLLVGAWIGWKEAQLRIATVGIFCLAFSLFFFLSVILHLTAYSQALLDVLRQRMGVEREF